VLLEELLYFPGRGLQGPFWCRDNLPKSKNPAFPNVVCKLQVLGKVPPELLTHSVSKATSLGHELLVDSGPLSDLDNKGVIELYSSETMHVSKQSVCKDISVPPVIFGTGQGEAVSEAVQLFGIDSEDLATPLKEGLNNRAVRDLDRNVDLAKLPVR